MAHTDFILDMSAVNQILQSFVLKDVIKISTVTSAILDILPQQ
jgi:hypothetical protein